MKSRQPRCSNVIDEVEPSKSKLRSSNGKIIRYEEKPINLLCEIMSRFASTPGSVIMDYYGGTFTTAIACFYFGNKCVGFEKDATIKEPVMMRLKETIKTFIQSSF